MTELDHFDDIGRYVSNFNRSRSLFCCLISLLRQEQDYVGGGGGWWD